MQVMAAKALSVGRQPTCFPLAVRQRAFKLDAQLGQLRIEPPGENAKARQNRIEQMHFIDEERKRLRAKL